MVLVLDDVHWAAKPTLLLLRHLLRSASIDGLDEAVAAAARHPGFTLIPAVELSCDVPGTEVHMLGLFVEGTMDFKEEAFKVRHRRFLVEAGTFARSLDRDVFAMGLVERCRQYPANAIDPLATGGALVVLIASVLAASIIPARRATKVPPTMALRA